MTASVHQQEIQPRHPREIFGGRRIHIFGSCGAEGAEILSWMVQAVPDAIIVAHDLVSLEQRGAEWTRTHERSPHGQREQFVALFQSPRITWAVAEQYETPVGADEIIFVPQSWFRYERNNFLRKFFQDDLRVRAEYRDQVWTLTRLYVALTAAKTIMITGSDGKTTTTRMVGAIMRAHSAVAGVHCVETGNDRTHVQSLAAVAALTPDDFLVLEVSDRQLSFGFPFAPAVAVVTNITPNKHTNDYGGFDAYVQVKANMLRGQRPEQYAVLNSDDAASRAFLQTVGAGTRAFFSLREKVAHGAFVHDRHLYVADNNSTVPIMSIDELGVAGTHNWYNACAAVAATACLSVSPATSAQALREFSGVPHRLQTVRQWRGITFIEDSAGGNPINIAVSIRAFLDRPLVLIIGGYRPDMTQEEIAPVRLALQETNSVHALLLIGQCAPQLFEMLSSDIGAEKLCVVEHLDGAFAWVQKCAELFPAGTVVCMTPGFESFDQYGDYRARAAHFVQLAQALP